MRNDSFQIGIIPNYLILIYNILIVPYSWEIFLAIKFFVEKRKGCFSVHVPFL